MCNKKVFQVLLFFFFLLNHKKHPKQATRSIPETKLNTIASTFFLFLFECPDDESISGDSIGGESGPGDGPGDRVFTFLLLKKINRNK